MNFAQLQINFFKLLIYLKNNYNSKLIKKYLKKDWYSYLNFLECLEERKIAQTTLNTKPFVLYLDPISYCNLQCPFCITGKRIEARPPDNMKLTKFKHIIDELGQNLFHIVLYNWGEPLLNNDLIQMIKYIQKYHITSELSTNLSLPMDQKKADDLIDSGIDQILMSVDGVTQETYQKYRVGGNLELVFKNMKLLSEAKKRSKNKPELVWTFLVFKHNEHELLKAMSIAKKLGVTIRLRRSYVENDVYDDWASTLDYYLPLNPKQVIEPNLMIPTSTSSVKKDTIKANQQQNSDEVKLRNLKNIIFPDGCDWLWYTSVINAGGSVSPCCIVNFEKEDFGNYENQNLLNLRNNEKYTKARNLNSDKLVDPKIKIICDNCPAKEIWHDLDNFVVVILESILSKLPSNLKIKNQSIDTIDWEFLKQLKEVLNKEIQKGNKYGFLKMTENPLIWRILRKYSMYKTKFKIAYRVVKN